MLNFKTAKERMLKLFGRFGLDAPQINKHLPTDPCDFTDPANKIMRLNIPSAKRGGLTDSEKDVNFYVGHNFGHYVCDLHGVNDIAQPDKYENSADHIADIIAELLMKGE